MTGRETGCVRVPSAPGRAPRPGRAGNAAFVVVPAAHGRGPHRAPAEATGRLPLTLAAPRAGPGPGPRNALSHARPLPWATLGEARRPSVPAPRRPAPPAGQAASRGSLTCDPPRSRAPGTPSAAWAPALRPRPGGGPRRQPVPRALPPSSFLPVVVDTPPFQPRGSTPTPPPRPCGGSSTRSPREGRGHCPTKPDSEGDLGESSARPGTAPAACTYSILQTSGGSRCHLLL